MVNPVSEIKPDTGLAFVIPAYSGDFIAETLNSLAMQTCRNFSVYIGDDCSPENLWPIIQSFHGRLILQYKRFDDRLGNVSLARHWKRSVELSSEEFFCLLADDDVLDRDCVKKFYAVLSEKQRYDVYRFNNAVIDETGELIAYESGLLRAESSDDFLYKRLMHQRMSFLSSYVVRREAYLREKGFVEFPLGWFSDDASVILFSRLTGIRWIAAPACWRMGGRNISSASKNTYREKIEAAVKYLKWLKIHHAGVAIGELSWGSEQLRRITEQWFIRHLAYAGGYSLGTVESLRIAMAIRPYCQSSTLALYKKFRSPLHKKLS